MLDFIITILGFWATSSILADACHITYIIRELINLKKLDIGKEYYKVIKKAFINYEINEGMNFTLLVPIYNFISGLAKLKYDSIENYDFSELKEYQFCTIIKNPEFLKDEEALDDETINNEEIVIINFKSNGKDEKIVFNIEDTKITFLTKECSDSVEKLITEERVNILFYLLYLIITNNTENISYSNNIKEAYVPFVNEFILLHLNDFRKLDKRKADIMESKKININGIDEEVFFVSYMENDEKKTIYFSFTTTGIMIRRETFNESFKDIPTKDVIDKLHAILLDISNGNTEPYEFSEELLGPDDKDKKHDQKLARKK